MKRSIKLLLVGIAVLFPLLACQISAGNTLQPEATLNPAPTVQPVQQVAVPNLVSQQDALISLYEKVSPGIVTILVLTQEGEGLGSGFVYDKEGHIVTNYHVVEGFTDLEVDFPSGIKVRGKVLGTDLDSDIAVLKVDVTPDQLVPLPLGNPNQLRVGETVAAIGNPFRYRGSMSVGIISALGRTLSSLHQTPNGSFFTAGDMIQTDTAINPGNSGGPLLNLNGEVIGINRAIETQTFSTTGNPVNSGIGFAISIGIVKRVIPTLIDGKKYEYPYLGLTSMDEISLLTQEALGLSQSSGAYVTSVITGGPADKAGLIGGSKQTDTPDLLAGGDLIIAIDGQKVLTFGDMLSYLINSKSPGDTVTLKILRDNKEMEVKLTLDKRP
jgi:S1-C subfamily serine protease